MKQEPPRRRPFNNVELALTSFHGALQAWKKAPVPTDDLRRPLKELGFDDNLSEYLKEEKKIKTGYALRQADAEELVRHFRDQLQNGTIAGGHLIVFSGNLRAYLMGLK